MPIKKTKHNFLNSYDGFIKCLFLYMLEYLLPFITAVQDNLKQAMRPL
jgi:hypothetical protein